MSSPYASTIPYVVLMKSPDSSVKSVVTATNRSLMFNPSIISVRTGVPFATTSSPW